MTHVLSCNRSYVFGMSDNLHGKIQIRNHHQDFVTLTFKKKKKSRGVHIQGKSRISRWGYRMVRSQSVIQQWTSQTKNKVSERLLCPCRQMEEIKRVERQCPLVQQASMSRMSLLVHVGLQT